MSSEEVKFEDLQPLLQMLETLSEDSSIPKNVRASITKAKIRLGERSKDINAVLTSAIHALEEVVNDINMPMHGRTMVWNLLSELEVLKEKTL